MARQPLVDAILAAAEFDYLEVFREGPAWGAVIEDHFDGQYNEIGRCAVGRDTPEEAIMDAVVEARQFWAQRMGPRRKPLTREQKASE